MIDLQHTQGASYLPGLQDLGNPLNTSFSLGVITIPAQSTYTTSVVLSFVRNDVISTTRVNFTGTTYIGSYWIPIFGQTIISDIPLAQTPNPSYQINTYLKSHPSGREFVMQFINRLNNAVVNTPSLTLNVHSHFYSYPW